jgi:alkylhydroperoxidase/carboxymuconolactone decarboxylase family protein YurZ
MAENEKGLTLGESALPRTYERFSERYPDIARSNAVLGKAAANAGPLERKVSELVKLGISLGAGLESAAKSHARRALGAGATREEVEHAVLLGVSTVGFSRTVMTWVWVTEQLDGEGGAA